MKKLNLPLVIGSVILTLLLIIIIFDKFLVTMDPYEKNIIRDVELMVEKAPFPPDDKYIIGSDIMGRDIYSRIITGTKLTLLIAFLSTLFKFVFSLPIAFLSGFKSKICSFIIRTSNSLFNGIPALLFAILILSLPFIGFMSLEANILIFAMVIGFIESSRVGKIIEGRVNDILNMNFIQGEIAVGKSNWQIAYRNVLPHITPSLIIHFCLEIGRSVLFIAKLGVFGVFIASGFMSTGNFGDKAMLGLSFDPEYFPEWGGMLSSARYAITTGQLFVIFYTVLAVFITILGFNLFGEGLKRYLD